MPAASTPPRRHARRRAVAAALVLATVAAGCGGGGDDGDAGTSVPSAPVASTTPTSSSPDETGGGGAAIGPVEGPEGDAFWTPPDPLPGGEPGDAIWTRPLPASPAGGTAELVLYRSADVQGDPVAVSGVVITPPGDAPADGRPVLAVAHGTTGMADRCAPSRQLAAGQATEISLLAGEAARRGWVLVATDYEGLGTPGEHTYLVGESEGRSVLDLVRTAQRLPQTGATATSPVAIVGHSQGGGAAAFAAELAPDYAPELDVRGSVAGAPATELSSVAGVPAAGPQLGFGMMIVAGFHAAYPDLPLDAVLTPAGQAALAQVDQGCVGDVLGAFASQDPAALLAPAGTGGTAPWADALADNTAGEQGTSVPMYVFHGDADTIVPIGWSEAYQRRACAAGTDVTRVVYPAKDHLTVVVAALPTALDWLQARVDGEAAAAGCP